MTDQANPTLGKIENVIKKLAWDNAITAALTHLGINIWPINTIVTMVTDKAFELLREGFDVAAIKFINDKHKDEFARVSVTLKIIGINYGIESEEFKRAKENAKAALAKYSRYGAQ